MISRAGFAVEGYIHKRSQILKLKLIRVAEDYRVFPTPRGEWIVADRRIWPEKAHGLRIFAIHRVDSRISKIQRIAY